MTGLAGRLDGASNVLLASPSMGGSREVCSTLLTEGLDRPSVLFVSFTRSASACLSQWEDLDAEAENLAVVAVGTDGSVDRPDVTTRTLTSPSDLTGLGVAIGQVIAEWEAPVAVCFDSLTAMLQYVDFETAYEFCHAVTGQFHAAGARAHFHVDPQALEPRHVAGLTSLVDARVDDGEGGLTVRSRDVIE